MENDKNLAVHYALRFGQIAMKRGFVTEHQLNEALAEQLTVDVPAELHPHKLIGEILFEKGWITLGQVELVLADLFRERH